MKKIAAILLLGILVFNWHGYRLLITFLEERANSELELRLIDDHYDPSELVSVKLPVNHLPYYSNSAIFERVNGEIEINGTPFTFIKQRIYNDSLELVCIPNHEVKNLRSAKDYFYGLVNDMQRTLQNKKPGNHPGPVKTFKAEQYTVTGSFLWQNFFSILKTPRASLTLQFPSFYPPSVDNPPELLGL